MIPKLLKLAFLSAVIAASIYLTPTDIKKNLTDKITSIISGAAPDSLKEKMDPLIHTPIERRAELIAQLEKNLAEIRQSLNLETYPAGNNPPGTDNAPNSANTAPETIASEEMIQKLEEAEKLVEQINKLNTEQGVINKITTAVYQQITGNTPDNTESQTPTASTSAIQCPASCYPQYRP